MASILIVVAMLSPSALVFFQQSQSSEANLSACCRRDGKHHCAMMMQASSSDETQIKSETAACPFRCESRTTVSVIRALVPVFQTFYAELISHPAIHEQTFAQQRVSETRAHLKRGPPTLP